jgi:hypothetical protein
MRYESLLTLKELQALGIIKGKANRAASLGYLQRLCRIGTSGTKLRSVKRNGEWLTTKEWAMQFNERILPPEIFLGNDIPRETTEAALRLLGVYS